MIQAREKSIAGAMIFLIGEKKKNLGQWWKNWLQTGTTWRIHLLK